MIIYILTRRLALSCPDGLETKPPVVKYCSTLSISPFLGGKHEIRKLGRDKHSNRRLVGDPGVIVAKLEIFQEPEYILRVVLRPHPSSYMRDYEKGLILSGSGVAEVVNTHVPNFSQSSEPSVIMAVATWALSQT